MDERELKSYLPEDIDELIEMQIDDECKFNLFVPTMIILGSATMIATVLVCLL